MVRRGIIYSDSPCGEANGILHRGLFSCLGTTISLFWSTKNRLLDPFYPFRQLIPIPPITCNLFCDRDANAGTPTYQEIWVHWDIFMQVLLHWVYYIWNVANKLIKLEWVVLQALRMPRQFGIRCMNYNNGFKLLLSSLWLSSGCCKVIFRICLLLTLSISVSIQKLRAILEVVLREVTE